ncbi:hypothetical protein J437_LFUL005269 [Ladona fulva]|uniref:VLRF1 domain-containing protein n=1 Tax=Ladona fulva TaxID=123851 RepID=A0A8K0KJG1_LADFU|nr:hypothetical protein J437_LFUL005269 [Ladona fulva]
MGDETCVAKILSPYKLHSLFDQEAFNTLMKGIKIANFVRPKYYDNYIVDEINTEISYKVEDLTVSETLYCSYCCVSFDDKAQQRNHYKLDWHRYNLKQNLEGKKPVTEEKFDQLADDVSSISGSDTEEEEPFTENMQAPVDDKCLQKPESNSDFVSEEYMRQPKVFFENGDGNIISVYRCILHGKKDIPVKESQLISLAQESQSDPSWAVVMLGGGHFAAAVFKGEKPVAHKTFHCYTVRAGQGGSQGSRDAKSATSHPKSAGASLRRYNEASLIQHVQEILQGWSDLLAESSRIFWRAAGPHNQSVLFGGKSPPLNRADLRLRKIPFPTRRPTFFEVQRVHKVLSSLEIYGKAEDFVDKFPVSPRSIPSKKEKKPYNSAVEDSVKEDSEGKNATSDEVPQPPSPRRALERNTIDRGKPRPSPCRPLPEIVMEILQQPSEPSDGEDYEIVVPTLQSFEKENLMEYEDTVKEDRKKVAEKKSKNKSSKSGIQKKAVLSAKEEAVEVLDERILKLGKDMLEACRSGDVDLLKLYIASIQEKDPEKETKENMDTNEKGKQLMTDLAQIQSHLFEDGFSILHTASSAGHPDVIRLLLESGFDPAIKNKKGQSPYAFAANKEIRNTFRRFMADFPDKYDYVKAQVPGPLTEELEKELEAKAAERRKLARKAKKEKEKVKRQEEEERKERERFLNLSEREKAKGLGSREANSGEVNQRRRKANCDTSMLPVRRGHHRQSSIRIRHLQVLHDELFERTQGEN